jgi:hypothetical protein
LNTGLKIGLFGGAALLVMFIANKAKAGKELAQNISYRIIGFGVPQIKSFVLSVPLVARITNPTQHSITIDKVAVTGSYLNGKTWQPSATAVFNNVTINPGDTDKQFLATVDFKALAKNVLSQVDKLLTSGYIDVKADVLITVGGITLPVQSFTKSIKVA